MCSGVRKDARKKYGMERQQSDADTRLWITGTWAGFSEGSISSILFIEANIQKTAFHAKQDLYL